MDFSTPNGHLSQQISPQTNQVLQALSNLSELRRFLVEKRAMYKQKAGHCVPVSEAAHVTQRTIPLSFP